TLTASERPAPLDYSGLNARQEAYRMTEPQDLRGPIFLAALVLLLIDCLVVFWLSGGIARIIRGRRPAAAGLALAAVLAVSPAFLARIDAYMKQGGTVLFDTRDAIMAPPGPGGETRSPGMSTLRTILSSLDIPELEPVPREHVLTKTFYLLKDFPGRFNTGTLWVEAMPAANEDELASRPARAGDGVSSILITSNDFAGAWAMRQDGQ